MRKSIIALCVAQLLAAPICLAAEISQDKVSDLQRQVESLNSQVIELTEWLEENDERLDDTERHTALDRIQISGDFRTKVHTLSYDDVTYAPGANVDFDDFAAKAMQGVFGDPMSADSPIGKMMQAYPDLAQAFMAGQLQGVGAFASGAPQQYDIDNDMFYTTRLRLNLRAEVWDNVSFSGRLTMFKNWGDDTDVQVFDSWRSFNMDGTSSGNPSGDDLFVERAYFDWKNVAGSPLYISFGRRPSTYGVPTNFRENEKRGGTPSGHVVNFNFDGATFGYHMDEITGTEGQVVRLCLGQGYESEYGNGELYNEIVTKDTYLGGFNIDLLNDDNNFLQFILFGAKDINDGFKGTFAMPDMMLPEDQQGTGISPVVRYQPGNVIGDMLLGGLTFAREEDNDIKWFTSVGWTRSMPNGEAGMFGGFHSDAVYQVTDIDATGMPVMAVSGATSSKDRDGYSLYAGIQVPVGNGKFGLEYNYGSKYWTPFTQAQDDPIGSKLATRGHVGELYYMYDINPNMFIKLAGLYYDYEYSGSGTPVGEPQSIDELQDGTAVSLLPVIDKAYDINASITVKF